MSGAFLLGRDPEGKDIPIRANASGGLVVDIGTNIDVSIDNASIEISNDTGNPIPVVSGLSIPKHDYAELSYTGEDVTGVTYKVGGTWNTGTDTYTGGTTVGQLELVYSSGKLIKVVEV